MIREQLHNLLKAKADLDSSSKYIEINSNSNLISRALRVLSNNNNSMMSMMSLDNKITNSKC